MLQALTDPNLVFFLLLVGLAGVGFEIFHPGAIVPAVVGAICLLLALAGLAVLPFPWTGIALLALAVALFIAETQVAGVRGARPGRRRPWRSAAPSSSTPTTRRSSRRWA